MSAGQAAGANDRPRDASISSTALGLPDDSSRPPDVDEAEAAAMERKLKARDQAARDKELRDAIELPVKGSA